MSDGNLGLNGNFQSSQGFSNELCSTFIPWLRQTHAQMTGGSEVPDPVICANWQPSHVATQIPPSLFAWPQPPAGNFAATCANYCCLAGPIQYPPSPPAYPYCMDMLPQISTNTNAMYCDGALCTCAYVVQNWRGGMSGADYCDTPVNMRLGHLWSSGGEGGSAAGSSSGGQPPPEVPIHTICPATCANYYRGPCAPPGPPTPPQGPLIPPFAPCTDMMPAIATTSQPFCEGSLAACTCTFIFQFWRGGMSGAAYCDMLVRERLGHMWVQPADIPQGQIYTICPATCAGFSRGPCAPPAPPSIPVSPGLPPFAPCTDMLPAIATTTYGHCDGSIERCTCAWIFERWRGELSGAAYCTMLVSQRLGHLWASSSDVPQGAISTICASTCALYGVGPCHAPPQAPPSPPMVPPPPPPPIWGPFPDGMVGLLVATDPTSGSQFTVQLEARNWIGGASEANPQPTQGPNAWVATFQSTTVPLQPGSGTELQLGDRGHITVPTHPPPVGTGSAGLHINCGTWTPDAGPGAMVIALGSTSSWYTSENAWTVNGDNTVSPVLANVGVQSDFVLAWGTFRWSPCNQPNYGTTVVLERADNATVPKFYFTPTQPAPPIPPTPRPQPPPPPTRPAVDIWREQCCATTGRRAQEELLQSEVSPWGFFTAAVEQTNRAYFDANPAAERTHLEARRARQSSEHQ